MILVMAVGFHSSPTILPICIRAVCISRAGDKTTTFVMNFPKLATNPPRGSACLAGAASAELRHWTCESSPTSWTKVESSIGFPRPQSQRDSVGAGSLPFTNGGELRLGYQRLQAGCLRYVGPSQCGLRVGTFEQLQPSRLVRYCEARPLRFGR
jgi:hypothetical protein